MDPVARFCARTPKGPIVDAYFADDLDSVIVFNRNGTMSFLRFRPKPKQTSIQVTNSPISAVGFSYRYGKVIVGDTSGAFLVISKQGKVLSKKHHKQSSRIVKIEFSPDFEMFACASEDGSVKIYTTDDYRMLMSFYEHPGIILDLAFAPDGSSFITACSDRKIRRFTFKTKSPQQVFGPFPVAPTTIAYNPRQNSFIAGFMNGLIGEYAFENGKLAMIQKIHTTSVTEMDSHPSGVFLLTASSDNGIGVVNMQEGQELMNIKAHKSPISSITWSPCGNYFISTDIKGFLMVWDFPDGKNVKIETSNDTSENDDKVRISNNQNDIETLPHHTNTCEVTSNTELEYKNPLPEEVGNDCVDMDPTEENENGQPQAEEYVDVTPVPVDEFNQGTIPHECCQEMPNEEYIEVEPESSHDHSSESPSNEDAVAPLVYSPTEHHEYVEVSSENAEESVDEQSSGRKCDSESPENQEIGDSVIEVEPILYCPECHEEKQEADEFDADQLRLYKQLLSSAEPVQLESARTDASDYIEVEPILYSDEEDILDSKDACQESAPQVQCEEPLVRVEPILVDLEDPDMEEDCEIVSDYQYFENVYSPVSDEAVYDENEVVSVEPILLYLEEDVSSDGAEKGMCAGVAQAKSGEFTFLTAIDPDRLNSSLLQSSSDDQQISTTEQNADSGSEGAPEYVTATINSE